MPDSWIPALIGAGAALVGVYATQFLAEGYRRFRDGSALAAGYVGEMHFLAGRYPALRKHVCTWIEVCEHGFGSELTFRLPERESPMFYTETISRIGLLDPVVIKGVVRFYSLANGFGAALRTLAEHHKDMTNDEVMLRCRLLLDALDEAKSASDAVLPVLEKRVSAWWLCAWAGGWAKA